MDCDSYENYNQYKCQANRLKEHCDKFKGVVDGNKCKIGNFNLSRSDHVFEYKKEFQEHILISPQEFLDITPSTDFRKENIEELKDKIKNKEMDVLFLDVDVQKCKVLDHEGRNRAKASQELGIDKIPVVIFKKEFNEKVTGLFGTKGLYLFSDKSLNCDKLNKQKENS